MCTCTRHQHVQHLVSFLGLEVCPCGVILSETAPHTVRKILLTPADEAVARCSVASVYIDDTNVRAGDLPIIPGTIPCPPRVCGREPEELACHIALALRQLVVPALAFLFEHDEQGIF